jgi:hypothetical protein
MCVWGMIAWSIVRALVAQPWLFRNQHGNLTRRKVWKGNWFHWCVLWSPLRWFFWIWWSLLSKSFWHVLVWMQWLQRTIHSLPKIITLLSLQDLILNTGWDYDGLNRLSTLLRDQRLGRENYILAEQLWVAWVDRKCVYLIMFLFEPAKLTLLIFGLQLQHTTTTCLQANCLQYTCRVYLWPPVVRVALEKGWFLPSPLRLCAGWWMCQNMSMHISTTLGPQVPSQDCLQLWPADEATG